MPGLVGLPLSLLESPSWRVLANPARRLLARLEAEIECGAGENGALKLSRSAMISAGIRPADIQGAWSAVVALGLVVRTEHGWAVTYAPTPDRAASNEWRSISDLAAARAALRAAQEGAGEETTTPVADPISHVPCGQPRPRGRRHQGGHHA